MLLARWTLLSCVVLVASSPPAWAVLNVNATVTPQGGSFQYDLSVENTGLRDFVLVSVVDAPLADPLLGPTLEAPAGYLAAYDTGLGIVDLLEDASLFAAGTTTSGFRFQSLSGPAAGVFTSFEAFDVDLQPLAGNVGITLIPEPASIVAALLATTALVFAANPRRALERRGAAASVSGQSV